MATDKKRGRGRPNKYEQTPERIYHNTTKNLFYKLQTNKITKEEYIRLKTEAKIKLLQARINQNNKSQNNLL